MKKPAYECKQCGKTCNGGGVSFDLIPSESKGLLLLMMSTDMDRYLDHACGREHMVQIFSDSMAQIQGVKDATEEAAA